MAPIWISQISLYGAHFSMSSSCVPYPMHVPLSSTRIFVIFITLETRCAIMIKVAEAQMQAKNQQGSAQ